jgi:hypothetical protein
MKKIVASVGLVALSASGLKGALIPGLDEANKPWSVSATLRGFYDDNRATAPDNSPAKNGSWGFEVSPSINLDLKWEQTTLKAWYVYSYKWYDKTIPGEAGHGDSTHIFNAQLDHIFNERYNLTLRDSFVVGQEPDVLRTGNAFTTFQRISGNNIRDDGDIIFRSQWTPLVGTEMGYGISWFDYSDSGGNGVSPSFSGLLDRVENRAHLDARFMVLPETVALAGYQFRSVDYTAGEEIGFTSRADLPVVHSNDRNFYEHYFYVGAEEVFNPELTASVRVGARYIDFYNDPAGSGNGWGPYALANLRYVYMQDSYVELGLSHDMNATDVVGGGGSAGTGPTSFTASSESTSIYGSVNQKITPKLRGSLIGQFQHSDFSGGAFNGSSEDYYLVGLNLTYQFTPHFSAEVGYNYDNLQSEVAGRTFDRNRVYIGVTGSY